MSDFTQEDFMVFQVSQDDVDRSSTLDQDDLGKWCFVLNATIQGFCSTQSEALALYQTCTEWSSAS